MPWQSIRGHDAEHEKFQRALEKGRLASTFLFVGQPGIGKRAFALKLAQSMLCERAAEQELNPCGACPSCQQVLSLNHPDVELIAKPPDKAFLPLELLIGDAEHRMQAGLCYNIALRPFSNRRRIAIIDDADYLNKEGANSLLKTLEEPPPKSILILIGTSEQRQLPTIRSRCQIVRFSPLAESDVLALLIEHGLCDDEHAARHAAALSGGSLERALLWCDASLVEFRGELFELLSKPTIDLQPAAKRLLQFVDEAGKESAAKRERLRLIVSLAEQFFRAVLQSQYGDASQGDPALDESSDESLDKTVRAALGWMSIERPAANLEVCLQAYAYIDSNANQSLLIEWWLDELFHGAAAAAR
jgi:DNA polymerase-3 subunit delta'